MSNIKQYYKQLETRLHAIESMNLNIFDLTNQNDIDELLLDDKFRELYEENNNSINSFNITCFYSVLDSQRLAFLYQRTLKCIGTGLSASFNSEYMVYDTIGFFITKVIIKNKDKYIKENKLPILAINYLVSVPGNIVNDEIHYELYVQFTNDIHLFTEIEDGDIIAKCIMYRGSTDDCLNSKYI